MSGSHYDKLMLFSKFVGLNFISRQTFQYTQRLYIIPSITSFWEDMKSEIWKVLTKEQLVLCCDGMNDSPGHSAKYCVYVLMEHFFYVIVDIEVTDKWQTGGVSTNIGGIYFEKVVGEDSWEAPRVRNYNRCFHCCHETCKGYESNHFFAVEHCVLNKIFIFHLVHLLYSGR